MHTVRGRAVLGPYTLLINVCKWQTSCKSQNAKRRGEADEREGKGKRREGIKGGKGREGRRGDGSIPALLFPT